MGSLTFSNPALPQSGPGKAASQQLAEPTPEKRVPGRVAVVVVTVVVGCCCGGYGRLLA